MVILAADLGGTHSRFALYGERAGALEEKAFLDLPSGAHDFAGLLRSVQRQLSGGTEPTGEVDAVSLAAAGAVSGGMIRMTNARYVVDAGVASAIFPGARVLLMNDFEAQARGCLAGNGNFLEPLHGDACAVLRNFRSGKEKRPVAVLGAGTGLGAAWLIRDARSGMGVLPSEAGHVPFPFHGREELAFAAFLEERCGGPSRSVHRLRRFCRFRLLPPLCAFLRTVLPHGSVFPFAMCHRAYGRRGGGQPLPCAPSWIPAGIPAPGQYGSTRFGRHPPGVEHEQPERAPGRSLCRAGTGRSRNPSRSLSKGLRQDA